MPSGTTTVRVTADTAERIAALRASEGRSTDAVLREALDALYWARMAEAARGADVRQGVQDETETALWDRAVQADLDAGR